MRLTSTARLAIVASQLLVSPAVAQVESLLSSVVGDVASATVSAPPSSATSSAPSQSTPSREPTVHLIKAGAGGFKFTPQEISNVSVGDIVSWEFYPPDHSVARAEFGSACVPYEETGKDKVGFWSGTQWVNDTSQITYFNITINSTEPIFYYCAAPNSCIGEHMVGVINPNSTQTLASQVQAAAAADFQIAPGEPIPAEATSSATPPPASNGNNGSHKLSTGAIAGIAVGGVAFLALCAALFFFIGRSNSQKNIIKQHEATNSVDPHMSQYGSAGARYGDGGLASPGFAPARPGYATPPPGHLGDHGYGSPPQYGQHGVGEAHPGGWTSPVPHQGHLSMMSSTSGMSQAQLDQLKYAHTSTQAAPAELHSPPIGQQGFSAELEAPVEVKRT
ncbi:hypothetical protein COCMIDRAFT_33641 [Bipolaris oryzae ATCC 44560]|uniref:Blue (type 1) copper domain-containing protein n=1 Tax=Bipolaris oryzae ATCC 44560 TaxID=930090 RepID=W6ZB12_COCMI|nr:uncharacterized protein COCMIDRAFT_33641 [Bipolaris oryzae ATCC 44560]EUC48972.1 hypothetical protein COCMIDRAFT_33641 [Bipolaris oryzae ATCC 44560]